MSQTADREESFEQRAERMASLARERGDCGEPRVQALTKQAEIIQFPLWPEPERAAPNAFLRSALFGVVKKGDRHYCKQEKLAAWPDVKLKFTGERLDQYDEDVWLELVHLHHVQRVSPGTPVYFTSRGFLRALGRSYGSTQRAALYDSLARLEACAVHLGFSLDGREVEYFSSLVQEAVQEKGTDRWRVVLNPRLLPYFSPGNYSRFDWQIRLSLKADLAKWLQGYVATQSASPRHPHRIAIARLHELSGATAELKKFRFNVRKAMAKLEEAEAVFRWRITEGDALEFVRRSKVPPEDS